MDIECVDRWLASKSIRCPMCHDTRRTRDECVFLAFFFCLFSRRARSRGRVHVDGRRALTTTTMGLFVAGIQMRYFWSRFGFFWFNSLCLSLSLSLSLSPSPMSFVEDETAVESSSSKRRRQKEKRDGETRTSLSRSLSDSSARRKSHQWGGVSTIKRALPKGRRDVHRFVHRGNKVGQTIANDEGQDVVNKVGRVLEAGVRESVLAKKKRKFGSNGNSWC